MRNTQFHAHMEVKPCPRPVGGPGDVGSRGRSRRSKDTLSLDLESLLNMKVTTASKFAEKLSDAPGVISVVSKDELQRLGAVTLRQGTGLGLTISTRLVALMGGRIWVESAPRSGSHFHFTVRLEIPKNQPVRAASVECVDLKGHRILVVKDNLTNRTILRHVLTHWDVDVTVVDSGATAVETAAAREFDVVLMDV